jgi:hypothetical protein
VLRLPRNDVAGKARHDELDSGGQDGARIPLTMVSDPIYPFGRSEVCTSSRCPCRGVAAAVRGRQCQR